MQKRVLVTAVLVVVVGIGLAIEARTLAPLVSKPAPSTVTISIEEMHRRDDVKSLPVQEVREPF